MRADGSYRKLLAREDQVNVQEILMKEAQKAVEEPKLTAIERMQPMYKK